MTSAMIKELSSFDLISCVFNTRANSFFFFLSSKLPFTENSKVDVVKVILLGLFIELYFILSYVYLEIILMYL